MTREPIGSDPQGAAAPAMTPADRRFGFIAVIGAPNAGKSTLVNMLVGAKVTIVSHKVQTTRMPVRGIAIEGKCQLVFVDTPGIFRPKRRLDRAMVEAAWGGASEADGVVLMSDAARGIADDVEPILERFGQARGRKVLALNKIDRLDTKETLLALVDQVRQRTGVEDIFLISALNGAGVEDLKRHLAKCAPMGPWHYPADDITDLPLRMLAAEITREKIFNRLHEELPYAITVETTQWKDLRDGSARIEQTIFVERESQRKIVLGKGGQTIKQISSDARKEIADILERKAHLFLFVKVREGWGDDPERYRELGLEFPKG